MVPSPLLANQSPYVPVLSEIQIRAQEVFRVRPCRWQLKVAEAILKREKDVVCMAGTGMGHALAFWMPLLFRPDGIQIVVRTLNCLGKQDTASLAEAGIQAISIDWETATLANFHAIRTFQYRVVVITPEQAMKPDGEFENLLSNPLFASRIISIVIDEAHHLIDRGRLRLEYQELGRLRYVLSSAVPFLVTSTALTRSALCDITRLMHMHMDRTIIVHRSSDRPNIKIGVKKIKYALNSFDDLAFLVPVGFKVGDPPPPKFLVFFDDIDESVKAARVIRSRLPLELQDKIKWFNDDMSTIFKKTELENLGSGETWGLFTTMTFGTGMDVPDIILVVQWRATCTVAALWDRFGHAVRDNGLTGTALLFAEKACFDDEKATRAARKARARRAEAYIGSEDDADDDGSSEVESDDEGTKTPPGMNSNDVSSTPEARVLLDALTKWEGAFRPTTRPQKRELDPGLDFLINAETREGMECRRKIFDICFVNAAADHRDCNADSEQGCVRCHVMEPAISSCCDIHDPTAFLPYESHVPRPPRIAKPSRLPKYTKDKDDLELEDALENWRKEKTKDVYGCACLNDYGPSVVMTNSTLDCIVDYAHHRKIHTPQDLKQETGWSASERFGDDIITLIQMHAAP